MSSAREVVPPWEYVVSSKTDSACLFCNRGDVPIMLPLGDGPCGLCEACAVLAYHAWKREPGDVPPGLLDEDAATVSAVRVVVARRRKVDGVLADAGHLSSYEILYREGESGLPGADVDPEAGALQAVDAALAEVRVRTWGTVVRLLCRAHLPRGRLCAVYLAEAWACDPGVKASDLDFRDWPPSDHAVPGMRGFCATVEDVLAVELLRRRASEEAELSVHMRECASKYVNVQREKRAGTEVDDSMSEVYRRSMTEDERRVARRIRLQDEAEAAVAAEEASGTAAPAGEVAAVEAVDAETADEARAGAGEVVDAEFTEGDPAGDEEWPAEVKERLASEESVPEGFARRGTPLSKK